jgi:hypothetical protein
MSNIAANPRRPTGASVGIPPRQMRFTIPTHTDRHPFFNNNVLASSMFVVFSGIFPPGERFFMESVRHFRDQITDPTLKAQISGFMGQEALHGREHEHLNAYFAERGIDVAIPERLIKISLGLLTYLPKRQQLACTTMMEHFTAHLAEQWVTDDRFQKTSDPEMLKLWFWHALEEMEHKAVAYDVFDQVGGTQKERQLAIAYVVAAILPSILISWGWLILKDKQRFNFKEHKRGLKELFGRKGFISSLIPRMPAFVGYKFHPNQHDTKALEKLWKEKLFGENGLLLDEYKNREALAA